MIAAQPESITEGRQKAKGILMASLSIVLLLAISFDSTIIPTVILREYAWRSTVILLIVSSGLVFLNLRMKVSVKIWRRVFVFALIIGGFYLALVLAEAINSISAGSAPTIVRATLIRILTITPMMLTIFLASGGGVDVLRGVQTLVRPYLYLCMAIAIGGIIAWAIIQFNIVPWQDWLVSDVVSAKLNRKGGGDLYALPYYLGLVLVGAGDADFLGTFRISGWSAEPHMATLFVTPALFAVPVVFRGRKWWSILAYAAIIGFDFLAFSVTNIFGLIAIGGVVMLRYLVLGRKIQRIDRIVTMVTLLGLVILVFGGAFLNWGHVEFVRFKAVDSVSSDSVEAVHQMIANTNSLFGQGIFRDPNNDLGRDLEVGLISTAAFWAQAVILSGFGLLLFFSRRPTYPIGLALVYVVIHSMKDPSHVLWWPIYLYIVIIVILSMAAPTESRQPISENHSSLDNAT